MQAMLHIAKMPWSMLVRLSYDTLVKGWLAIEQK